MRTASGELISIDGRGRITGTDEWGKTLRISGNRVDSLHKALLSTAETAHKGWDTWLTKGGGWMIQRNSRIAQKIDKLVRDEARRSGHDMIPLFCENGVYNLYLQMGADGGAEVLAVESETAGQIKPVVKGEPKQSGFARPPSRV